METKIKELLKDTREIPSPYLKGNIWRNIEIRIQNVNYRNVLLSSFLSIVSLASLIFVSVLAYQDLLASGLPNYFSLLFSDWSTVGTLWKEFSYVILESLPVMSTILMLGVIFITMLSLKKSSTSFKQMNYSIK